MRLTDADTFIEYLGLDVENAREINLGQIVTLEDFDRQPTAYDVEGIVGKLEMESERYKDPVSSDSSFRRFCEGISAGYRYAADIVKAGDVYE